MFNCELIFLFRTQECIIWLILRICIFTIILYYSHLSKAIHVRGVDRRVLLEFQSPQNCPISIGFHSLYLN